MTDQSASRSDEAIVQRPQPCACRFEWRPMPDFSGASPKQLEECGFHSEQRKKLEAAAVSKRGTLLPGLQKALELCEQTRAWYETFLGRPLMAEQVWDIEVKMRVEIEREERRLHPAAQPAERPDFGKEKK